MSTFKANQWLCCIPVYCTALYGIHTVMHIISNWNKSNGKQKTKQVKKQKLSILYGILILKRKIELPAFDFENTDK